MPRFYWTCPVLQGCLQRRPFKRSWEVISWQISTQMNPNVVPVGSPFIHQPVQMLVKATLLPFELGAFKLSLVFHFSSDYYYFIHSVLKDSWPFVTACPFFLPWGLLFLRNTEYILQKVQVVLPSPSWGLCSYRLQRCGNVRKENIMAKKNKKVTFYIVKRCKQERFIFPPLSVKHSTTNQ